MRVTVCFGPTRIIVPCKGGATVAELVKEACARYKKAIGQNPRYYVKIRQLEHASDGGILDWDDYVYDVAEDRDQLIAVFDEEEDQLDGYNGNSHMEDTGSDGHRSPPIFQPHQNFNNRFLDGKSQGNNRGRSKAPTGNATVIKHDDRKVDHEVNVGADALKSGSNSSITVRGTPGSSMKEEDRIMSPVKKSSNYYSYDRMDSGNDQKDNSHSGEKVTDRGDFNFNEVPDKPEKHNFSSKGRFMGGNYDNFVRSNTRQSIMGYLSGEYVHDDGYEDDSYQLMVDQYLPPPPTNPSFYPRFYKDSQETFVDVDHRKLGIEIRSYKENKVFLGLLVESVEKGGRSDREGLLQEGDVIVEINGHVLAHYDYSIAQEIFKDAMKFQELQLRVYPNEERERENLSPNTSPVKHKHVKSPSIPVLSITEPTPTKPRALSSAKSLPNLNDSTEDSTSQDVSSDGKLPLIVRMSLDTLSNNTRKIGNMFEIELRKGLQGLGFSITTRDTPIGGAGPIYVKNILPKGAAVHDGRLRAGDRILKVNDVELTGHSQESAVNILRCIEVGSTVKLVVSRHVTILPRKMDDDPVTDKALSDDASREYFKFEIALNDTGSAGLGISLKGNQSKRTKRDLGIFVKSVFHGGAAHQDGRLKPNDQLISVNAQSLIGMTNHEAIDTLRTSMSTVGNVRGMIQMVIARRKATGTEPLSPQFSSGASSEISDSLGNERGSRASVDNGGNSPMDDDYIRYSERVHHQSDPNSLNPNRDFHDGDWQSSDLDLDDPNIDPFSRESIFRQSISEKRKGAAARDTQNIDIVKLKNKQLSTEKADRKLADLDPLKQPLSPNTTPLKWVKPNRPSRNSSSSSTPTKQPGKPDIGSIPIPAKRNLNNSSNLPVNGAERWMNDNGSGMSQPQLSGSMISSVSHTKNPYMTGLGFSPPKPYAPPRYQDIVKTLKSKEKSASNVLTSSSDTDSLPVLKKSNSSDSIMNCGLYSGDHSFYPPLLAGNSAQISTNIKDISYFSSSAVLPNSDLKQLVACCTATEGNLKRRYLSPPYYKKRRQLHSPLTARSIGKPSIEQEVQVGPTLGIAKSSSLESLQTALENLNDDSAFLKAQPRVLRGRILNESFRAALDQPYGTEALTGKHMATLKEESNGAAISPLVKSEVDSGARMQEKKRGNKGYKLFGIFKVGKNKRSISSDRNLDSNSSTSSSPRLTENEAHKKYLESKREDDFRKHQEENERIQAKAKEMREKQEKQRKMEELSKSRENMVEKPIEDRVRAPSVPVTAMQRMSVDHKAAYAEASGRRSVDPITMRNSQTPTFDWNTSKRPTSPVNYHEHTRHRRYDKKSNIAKHKSNPDYSSLPRKPGTQSNNGALQNDSDGIIEDDESDQSEPKSQAPPSAYIQTARSGVNGSDYTNYEFYNMQKPPSGRGGRELPTTKQRNSTTPRKGRPGKSKSGRSMNHNDTVSAPFPVMRSKTPQPQSCHREDYSTMNRKSDRNTNATTDFATINRTFQREQSPEPPPVVMRRQTRGNTAASSSYRHSVHIDNPSSRTYERSQSAREPGQRPSVITTYWNQARPDAPNHDLSDSDRAASPSASTVEINRNAVKKLLDRAHFVEKRTGENFVISQPYNL